ncbi:MAG: hypothetical protein BWY30_00786 [Tenericutes bacterium ADurb.Bin239]|nr:MAG: hypothetical protein BWY30_00786 [Tenericutes bacterium ADurb.Bin239]
MNNIDLKKIEQITFSLNIIRLKRDIEYHETEVKRTKLHTVAETDRFFQAAGKEIQNLTNKRAFESNAKALKLKKAHLDKLYAEASELNVTLIEDINELVAFINEVFANEVNDLRNVYLAFSLIFTSPYYNTNLKEALRKESFNEFEKALALPNNFFINYEKDLVKKYHLISGKDQNELLDDAIKYGTIAGIIGFFISPLIGALATGTTIVAYTLSSAVGTGLIIGVLTGSIRYGFKAKSSYEDVKKAFQAMNKEEVDFMLLQKLALIEALNKHRDKEEVNEILQGHIDELINLKSDLDLALYDFRENKDNLNAKKKESFTRFDKYLLKTLEI